MLHHVPEKNDALCLVTNHARTFILPRVKEISQRILFSFRNVDVAVLTHSDRVLVTLVREDGSLGGAVVTHSLAAPPAVVLPQTNLLLVVHRFEVPEKRPAAQLAGVALCPVRGLCPLHLHVPADQPPVLPG